MPEDVRKLHDAIRNAYVYSYFSYDLLTLAAAQVFACLEYALRARIGSRFEGRVDRKGKPRPPPTLPELLETARVEGLLMEDIGWVNPMRRMFAHGSDAVWNPPMFLAAFGAVTRLLEGLFRLTSGVGPAGLTE